jgi:hypothetical protein
MASSPHNNKSSNSVIDNELIHQCIGHRNISALLAASEN